MVPIELVTLTSISDDLEGNIDPVFNPETKLYSLRARGYEDVARFDLETSKEAIALAKKYKNIWATVGFHPMNVFKEEFNKESYKNLILENTGDTTSWSSKVREMKNSAP